MFVWEFLHIDSLNVFYTFTLSYGRIFHSLFIFFLSFFSGRNLEIRQNIGLYVVRAPHQFLSTVVMIHTKLISNGFVYHRTMQFFTKILWNEILRIYRILCKYLFFITELRRFFSWELNPNCKLDCRRSCQGNVTILSRHD